MNSKDCTICFQYYLRSTQKGILGEIQLNNNQLKLIYNWYTTDLQLKYNHKCSSLVILEFVVVVVFPA